MTNKEREALEKIVNSNINEIPNKTDNDPYINMINYLKYIAKLTLKTPQECETKQCEFYSDIDNLKEDK